MKAILSMILLAFGCQAQDLMLPALLSQQNPVAAPTVPTGPLLNQDFISISNTPAGWTDSGTVSYDGTALNISGSSSSSTSPVFTDLSSSTSWSLFLKFSSDFWNPDTGITFLAGNGTSGGFFLDTEPNGSLRILTGNGNAEGGSFTGGTIYCVWVDYDGAAYHVYVSTNATKPGTETAILTAGSGYDFRQVVLYGNSYWQDHTIKYYRILVSTSTIGSNP